MKILNKSKMIIMALMAFGIFFVSANKSVAALENSIKSGIYEIENDVYHDSDTGMAMSRSYLVDKMYVEVRKDNITYTISFSGSDYMENYRIKVNGELVPVEVDNSSIGEGIVSIKADVDKVDADMNALIYVGPMERDVEFKVIPKMETLTLIEAIDEDITENEIVQETSEAESIVEAVSSASVMSRGKVIAVSVISIAAVIGIIGGTAIFIKAKKKKSI